MHVMHRHGPHPGHPVELMDTVRNHTEQYSSHVRDSYMAMVDVWADLEVDDDQQQQELQDIMADANGRWSAAVAHVKGRQQAVRDSIEQALQEIMTIKEELGSDNPAADAELQKLQGNRSGHRTLRAWQADVLSKAQYWQQCRKQRIADYEDLQARIRLLRQLCGLPPQPPPIEQPDIRRSNMEFLRLELERLATEKERREDLLRRLLDELSALCGDLGEDVKAAVAEVHEDLVYLWDSEAAQVLRDVYRLGSSYSSAVCGMVDLGDATISRLGSKLAAMKDLKASRDAHAAEVLAVLHSLWDVTEVPDAERAHFVRLMKGPLRLHASSLVKCMDEVRRLEDVRYQQMVDLVLAKGAELSALCIDSHVEEPAGLQDALDAMHEQDRNPGAAAELLAKLLHMLAEVQVLTSKRATIIAAINEVEAARQEDVWLASYEADDQRYKGRDANKKLQRAIRAGKLREKLPLMIEELRRLLAEWKDCEGEAFLFDGRDYEFEVLDGLAAEVEEAAAARAAKAAAASTKRRQSLAGPTSPGSATSASNTRLAGGAGSAAGGAASLRVSFAGSSMLPPAPAGGRPGSATPRATGAASSASRRVGGPATPVALRGVSSRSLTERHSICVVRDRDAVGGPAALSRSGEVRLRPTSAHHAGSSRSAAAPTASDAGAAARRRSGEGLTPTRAGAAGSRRASSENRSPAAAGAAGVGASPGANTHHHTPKSGIGSSSSSSVITPPRSSTKDAAAGSSCAATLTAMSSCKRASTSSKLNSIFTRSSVQHPVATLAGEPSGLHTDSRTPADQDQL